jgi:polyisoprenyl-phosphate glycosyltransferase
MISIVIPCFNEEAVLSQLASRLVAAADQWNEPWEAICVDDGSRDSTWSRLEEIARSDSRWKLVRFARNFGHQKAVSAGLAHAKGDAVFVIDADLQDPPEELYRFIDKWREGYEVVYAVRRKRKEVWYKRMCYYLFYRGLSLLSQTTIPLDSGDFCIMDQKVVSVLREMPEQNRFIRGMRAWAGFRQIGIEYERHARAAGVPQYTFKKLLQLASDGVLSFSTIPLRLATYLGLAVSTIAFFGAAFTLLQRWMGDWFASIGLAPAPGFATIVISVLFLGGVQLVCVGIIGEYIGRIYEEVKGRPLWIESDTVGIYPAAIGKDRPNHLRPLSVNSDSLRKAS